MSISTSTPPRARMTSRHDDVAAAAGGSASFAASVRRLLALLGRAPITLAAAAVTAVASVGLSVVGPTILGEATDVIFSGVLGKRHAGPGIDFPALAGVLLRMLALYLASSLFLLVHSRLLTRMMQRVVYDLRCAVADKLHRLPVRYLDGQPRGELLSRATDDVDNVATMLQQTLSQFLTSLLTVVGVAVMMFTIAWPLAAVAMLVLPASTMVARWIGVRAQRLYTAQWQHAGAVNAHVEELCTGHQLITAFGRQREAEAEFRRHNGALSEAATAAQFVSGLITPAMMFLSNLSYVGIAVVGGLRVASGSLTLGQVQAFVQYSRQFTQPLTQLASMANLLQSGVASAGRVFELLDAEEQDPDPSDAAAGTVAAVDSPRGRVAFENVSFGYAPRQRLIDGLSLVVEPGQTVAIVGTTGAGKSTLVNLIMRFYQPDSGRITLDGMDVARMRRADLRSRIGIVPQDTWLFAGTIRENIGYGDAGASQAQIVAAAQAALADHFIRTLPNGYDTLLEENGANISAGERQLLAIARASLANPLLLILDEATSSVDTRTEALIQHAQSALRSSRTSFVIAHRLSTIRDADLILVMESGRIVEHGRHERLLAAGGAYARLWAGQRATG